MLGGIKSRAAIFLGALLVLLIVVLWATTGIGHGDVPGDAVAHIDTSIPDAPPYIVGDNITKAGFDRALGQAAKRQGLPQTPAPNSPQYSAIRDAALGDLLDIAWILGEAEERGVSVSARQVQQSFQQTKQQNFKTEAAYQQFLKQSGYNQQDVNLRVKLNLVSTEIQSQISHGAPNASSDDARKYYDANIANYKQPESRTVRLVLNPVQARAQEAANRLQADDSPSNWDKVASALSTDTTTNKNGGLRESVTSGTLPQPLDSELFAAPQGQVQGPVKAGNGWYVYEVESIKAAATQPFAGQVASQIQQQLSSQFEQQSFTDFLTDYRAKWTELTICASGYIIDRCDNYVVPATGCSATQAKSAGCPAPVQSIGQYVAPGAPGSFLPFTVAAGQPQRPHPPGAARAAPSLPGSLPGSIPGGAPGTAPGG